MKSKVLRGIATALIMVMVCGNVLTVSAAQNEYLYEVTVNGMQRKIPAGAVAEQTGNIKRTFQYDASGKMTGETREVFGIQRNYQYIYDVLGRKQAKIGDGYQEALYVYNDALNTVTWYQGNQMLVTGICDALERIVATTNYKGVITVYEYDTLGRVVCSTVAYGTQLDYTIYTYNRYNDIVREETRLHTGDSTVCDYSYKYDKLGRVKSVSYVITETFDGVTRVDVDNPVTTYTY